MMSDRSTSSRSTTAVSPRLLFLFTWSLDAMRGIAVALALLVGSVGTARAQDCYSVKEGATLYAESMLQTPVATTSAEVVAWFGLRREDPGMRVRFVDFDGDRLVGELDAYVRPTDALPVDCPRPAWSRPWKQLKALTWPDARAAGTMLPDVIALRSASAMAREGRVCFSPAFASISAQVCSSLEAPDKSTCLALPRGTRLFARPSNSAKMGRTSAVVYARTAVQVGKFYRGTLFDLSGRAFSAYFLRAGTNSTSCPKDSDRSGMETLGPYQALLPNGVSVEVRIGNALSMTPRSKVRVNGSILSCGEEDILDGVTLKLCYVVPNTRR